jgi:hypothetical protein
MRLIYYSRPDDMGRQMCQGYADIAPLSLVARVMSGLALPDVISASSPHDFQFTLYKQSRSRRRSGNLDGCWVRRRG